MTTKKTSHAEQVADFLQRLAELSSELQKQVVNMVDDNVSECFYRAESAFRLEIQTRSLS